MNRSEFLQTSSLAIASSLLAPLILKASGKQAPVLLLVSGWQDVNIGDIAHTPGLIALLKQRIPGIKIILWKKSQGQKVEAMLQKHYPDVRIVHGSFNENHELQSPDVERAFREADFFVHGSGPSVVAAGHLRCWDKLTDKGFGIFGVTIQEISPELKTLLEKSSFIFTRETASVGVLKSHGLSGKHIRFAPDATFVLDIHDRPLADRFMKSQGLEPRKFICAIPRLRYTPYHQINPNRAGWSDEKIARIEAINDQYKEIDHAKLREAMIAWVKRTGHKVLVCPEMTYEVDLMQEVLIDPLPDEIKPYIVTHGYWLPDEAASVYENAVAVLSLECHSPIIAAANGIPSFYLRQPTDTIKGQMFYDLGFNGWVFEIDNTTGRQITERLMEIYEDYPNALNRVKENLKIVDQRYNECLPVMRAYI